ncbi:MAG TPA: hypothetical protein VK348_07850 [Planctomycetota bacterium]|nr:hypothetical protein [Planctomycetota bacterium]
MTIYLDLTRAFNSGRLRTIICSGQAVVLLRLAIASKDGDWILREDQEAIDHVLSVLEAHGASYRFGAPLDLRWLRQGWSSHFQFRLGDLRVRTDFFSRPPRVPPSELQALWSAQEGKDPPFTGPHVLLRIKQTGREKDWPIVGELARLLLDVRDQMLHSRSARDLLALAKDHPDLLAGLVAERPALAVVTQGLDELRLALERERFAAMDADASRIRTYLQASELLARVWSEIEQRTAGLPLRRAHAIVVGYAERWLPTVIPATSS